MCVYVSWKSQSSLCQNRHASNAFSRLNPSVYFQKEYLYILGEYTSRTRVAVSNV